MKKIIQNKDVPPEAVIRQLLKQVNLLKQENGILKSKLDSKDTAIKEFKKWQSRMAEYKWVYWLYEGVKLMETPPEEELHTRLKQIFVKEQLWRKRVKGVLLAYDQYEKAKSNLKTAIESSDKFKDILDTEQANQTE